MQQYCYHLKSLEQVQFKRKGLDTAQPPTTIILLVPGTTPLAEDVQEKDHVGDNSGSHNQMVRNIGVDQLALAYGTTATRRHNWEQTTRNK